MQSEGGLLTSLANGWQGRRQAWRNLDPVEQCLRRASGGFTLVAVTVGGVFFAYGWRGVLAFFPWLATDPGQAWPGAVFFGGLIAVGSVRFVVGVRRLAGVRDGLRASSALLKLAVGLAITIFLGRLYPWPGVQGWGGALALLAALYVGAQWVIDGGIRFAVLSLPRSSAFGMAGRDARDGQFQWPGQRRRWWQFWKR